MNFLSTARVKEKLDRGIWEVDEKGGTLMEKHPTADFWDPPGYVFSLDFPSIIRLPRTVVHLFSDSHFTIWLKSQIYQGEFYHH